MLGESITIRTGNYGWVKHAGRPQEQRWIDRLADFPVQEVDMSTLVILGSARTIREGDVLYEARGYAEKYLSRDC